MLLLFAQSVQRALKKWEEIFKNKVNGDFIGRLIEKGLKLQLGKIQESTKNTTSNLRTDWSSSTRDFITEHL